MRLTIFLVLTLAISSCSRCDIRDYPKFADLVIQQGLKLERWHSYEKDYRVYIPQKIRENAAKIRISGFRKASCDKSSNCLVVDIQVLNDKGIEIGSSEGVFMPTCDYLLESIESGVFDYNIPMHSMGKVLPPPIEVASQISNYLFGGEINKLQLKSKVQILSNWYHNHPRYAWMEDDNEFCKDVYKRWINHNKAMQQGRPNGRP